jgi:alkylation response protein AidB-like acyl-CoA dehydrogenase
LEPVFKRLTSRDPAEFWTSGQWMTERRGGSDVGSGTETFAIPRSDGKYEIYGYKWFSSATDSDMAITLARIANPDGTVNPVLL